MLKNVRLSIWIPLALMAAGCASVPPSSYYTLLPAQSIVATETSAAPVPSIGYAISVQRVIVPEQVNRPQIVLAKDNGAGVQLLNQSLWAAPLGDEWRNALSAALTARLGVLDIDLTRAPEGLPIWLLMCKSIVSIRCTTRWRSRKRRGGCRSAMRPRRRPCVFAGPWCKHRSTIAYPGWSGAIRPV